ncbi:hypothetical protein S7711_02670 [Stachybotrys chartarum IBT 7711]|uniref:Aminotransferase class V domain-containing protein n=1 Tax=Stachybotrys chartarum (strain CBS 109288 / IBT 7711) TaxID=1280523 RepID=A0A084AYX0_STACB|nr:hypothetical protein S7711_02670 [Stachybotrys chartarum IBT 7711]
MPSRSDITYFGAGPALLPSEILEDAAGALLNYNATGLGSMDLPRTLRYPLQQTSRGILKAHFVSVAEHSQRSQLTADIINQAKADLASCLDIPDDYEILFMQGGGTGEFSATVYNFVSAWVARKHKEIFGDLGGDAADHPELMQQLKQTVDNDLKIDYLVTGGWSQKASAEAERLLGPKHVNIRSPRLLLRQRGVEFPAFPKSLEPRPDGTGPIVVADMSSNILTRKIPVQNFSAIFFGAQKNLGVTGITVVVIKKSFLPPATRQPPAGLMRDLGLPVPPIIFQYEAESRRNPSKQLQLDPS